MTSAGSGKNPPRVESLEERKRIKGQRFEIGVHYVCGCGCEYWILLKNGDCVCAICRRAQARIIVNELAPVTKRARSERTKEQAPQPSTEINFLELVARFSKEGPDAGSVLHVLEAGAALANGIAHGMGPMIRGTFMEADFRNALKLREGETVNFRRRGKAEG